MLENGGFQQPDYIEETLASAREVISKFLFPLLTGNIDHPRDVWTLFQTVQGNFMAKSAVETAIWDLYGRQKHCSLTSFLSNNKRQACCRGQCGIQASTEQLVAQVADYVAQGYQRVKIKIKPGVDLEPLTAVRETFPELLLMADANGAYEDQPEKILALDELGLAMIEQPLKIRDLVGASPSAEAVKDAAMFR